MSKKSTQWRIGTLIFAAGVLLLVLVGRLVHLQVFRHNHYVQVAEAQRKRASELAPHRGIIYLTEGRSQDLFPVASNEEGWIAYAVPRDMEDPKKVVEELAPALIAFRQRQEDRIAQIIDQTGQKITQRVIAEEQAEENESEEKSEEAEDGNEEQPTPDEQAEALAKELLVKFDKRTDP